MRQGIPAGIKKNKQRANVVLRGNSQELVNALLETVGVLLPEQIVQKNAHGVHAQRFGPTQFLVDLVRIKRRVLPHFQFIDGGARDVIAPDKPRLLRIPVVRLFLGPANGARPSCIRTRNCKH